MLMVIAILCLTITTFGQELMNVALNGTATASTSHSDAWGPGMAIDGNTGTGSHSQVATAGEWLEIDLNAPYDLIEIRLVNRTDCCFERMDGNVITVMDADRNVLYVSDPMTGGTAGSVHTIDNDGAGFAGASIILIEQTVDAFVQIMEVEAMVFNPSASNPSPSDGNSDVPYYVNELSWSAGAFAVSQNVYVGSDVNDLALVADGVLETSIAIDIELGETYFWRVDGIGADATVYTGQVWSFTVEPVAYPITNITATASGFEPAMGPEKTIDGSGMTDGLHGVEGTDMWLGTGPDAWIQYEFDAAVALNDMMVWNSNQSFEAQLGFGIKGVLVETSEDGETWTVVEGATEFAQGSSAEGYAANTAVDFAGILAKYVKITGLSAYGFIGKMGLSEVAFSSIPVSPRELSADLEVPYATLNWRAGRFAVEHQVLVDGEVVATTTDQSYDISMDYGQEISWQIVDVAADGATYASDVMSLSAPSQAVITDINDLAYDNTEASVSEVVVAFDPPLDLTAGNPDKAGISFRGNANLAALTEADGVYTITGEGTDIWGNSDQFRFVFKGLTGDGSITAQVKSLETVNAWTKAGVMIRNTLDAGSVHAMMVATGTNGVTLQYRPVADAASDSDTGADERPAEQADQDDEPVWVRMERKGNELSGAWSLDGITWMDSAINPQTIEMGETIYIGMAVTSHTSGVYATAEISDVVTTGAVSEGWEVANVGVDIPAANDAAQVYATLKDSAGNAVTIEAAEGSTRLTAWTTIPIELGDLNDVDVASIASVAVGVQGDGAIGLLEVGELEVTEIVTIVPTEPDMDNLTVYLPLDGNSMDASGNGLHGTIVLADPNGQPNFIEGAVGMALDFSGGNDYVNIDGYKGINIDPNDPNRVQPAFSVTNWFKITATSGDHEMVTWGTSAGRQRLTWRVHQGRLRTEHAAGNLRGNTYVNDGEWHHGGLTVAEGANLRPDVTKMYVDGVEDTTFSGSNNPYELTAGADVRIGMSGPQNSRYWPGSLDEVRIYDRVLSAEEVAALAGLTESFDLPY